MISLREKPSCGLSESFRRRISESRFSAEESRVWCFLSDCEWALGSIHSTVGAESVVFLLNGKFVEVPTSKLLPANPEILEGVDDLIQLSYLNEPSILHNLQHRYLQDKIYTKAGPVLIAVNPFKGVQFYGNEYIEAYKRKSTDDPHVYQTADAAFEAMNRDGVNQSIIISGESGAGKTETAKKAMQYLAHLGGGGGIENDILQTNPILEAFGNAKTSRNNNSSRFGKLIDIHFDDRGRICGAKIQTYLLEKSRVVHQAHGERSYHIFYQFCAGAPPALRECLNLMPAEKYSYLNRSGCFTIDGVDDKKAFQEMMGALRAVKISKDDQENVFVMLAAILWLGNIEFSVIESDNCVEIRNDKALRNAAKLLGCDVLALKNTLTTRTFRAGNEDILQRLTMTQAIDARDTLAKAIYACLFAWLVENINKSLEVEKRHTGRSISILDIYGFESFEKNSLEQLCINYANERLQQLFNRHLFRLEQEEYSLDGIDWTKVDFEDNQECLELIEKKPIGILSLLDEECTFPKGNDSTLANKLKKHLSANSSFRGGRGKVFSIKHYAGEVTYETDTFIKKNRDLLHPNLIHLLSTCTGLPRKFASNLKKVQQQTQTTLKSRATVVDLQKQSVAAKFKGQLLKLMQTLECTSPHFIRCIKPNNSLTPALYEQALVLQQLRCCGVLEVARIARSGYPTRVFHQNFAKRYGFLLPSNAQNQDALGGSIAVLQQFGITSEMYQVGFTKIFLRTGQLAKLEAVRSKTLFGIVGVQKVFRGYRARRQFERERALIIYLQSYIKGHKARKAYQMLLQRRKAATIIQNAVRRRMAQKKFTNERRLIITVQSVIRGWQARKLTEIKKKLEEDLSDVKVVLEDSITDRRSNEDTDRYVEAKPFAITTGFPKPKKRPPLKELKVSEQDSENDGAIRVSASQYADLQMRVLQAEAALRKKEEENFLLQQKVYQYESKWSEYEAKMNSMEEVWQKQLASLQLSLVAAKKSFAHESGNHSLRSDNYFSKQNTLPRTRSALKPMMAHDDDEFDWDDSTSVGTKTPDLIYPSINSDNGLAKELDAGHSIVGHLVKEFDNRTQLYSDDLDFIVEVKSGQSEANFNPDEELRKLRQRVESWKKDFKFRLKETKSILQKLGSENSSSSEKKRRWWGKISG